MKRFISITALVLFVLSAAAWAADGAVLCLRERAESTGPAVRLSDVARITDPSGRVGDPDEILLGPAPRPGAERTFTLDDVKMRLDLAGVELAGVTFTGAKKVVVKRSTAPDASGNVRKLAAAARAALDAAVAESGVNVICELAGVGTEYLLKPDGRHTLQGEPELARGARLDRTGTVTVYVSVLEHDGYTSRVPVRFHLTVLRKVAVAARRIRRGEVISTNALRLEDRAEGEPGLPLEEVMGRKAAVSVPGGSVFVAGMIRELPLVRRRETVRVNVVRQGLRVTLIGRAKMDGAKGAVIEVENPKTRRAFLARVTGPGEVTVAAGAKSNTEAAGFSPRKSFNRSTRP